MFSLAKLDLCIFAVSLRQEKSPKSNHEQRLERTLRGQPHNHSQQDMPRHRARRQDRRRDISR